MERLIDEERLYRDRLFTDGLEEQVDRLVLSIEYAKEKGLPSYEELVTSIDRLQPVQREYLTTIS